MTRIQDRLTEDALAMYRGYPEGSSIRVMADEIVRLREDRELAMKLADEWRAHAERASDMLAKALRLEAFEKERS